MAWVLVIVTVFSSAAGVATDTVSVGFHTEAACRAAADSVRASVGQMRGTLGRQVTASCHATGRRGEG